MSVIRQDPTTNEWVIIATERTRRPHDFRRVLPAGKLTAHEPGCPFCPGNEGATPREVLSLGETDRRPWAVRVIPNKFAALTSQGELHRREPGPLFREMDGLGFHEVIIETPVHNRFIPLMEDAEVETVLSAYQQRYRTVRDDAAVKYIVIFKNHGEAAGTSLKHPHSQLVATPIPPAFLRRKYEVATRYYDDTGRCLYCDLVQAELEEHQRVILETERFVVFHPYASRAPFETWIAPRAHQPSFGRATADELAELASVLKRVLRGLYEALGDPDFNYIVHSAPAPSRTITRRSICGTSRSYRGSRRSPGSSSGPESSSRPWCRKNRRHSCGTTWPRSARRREPERGTGPGPRTGPGQAVRDRHEKWGYALGDRRRLAAANGLLVKPRSRRTCLPDATEHEDSWCPGCCSRSAPRSS